MTLFDLLFLLLFFAALATLFTVGWLALRKQFTRARVILRRLLLLTGVYMAIVIAVSLFSPRRILTGDGRQCFDDWCIAVTGVRHSSENNAAKYSIDLRLSSRARRVTQRENNLSVYLTGSRNERYAPITDSSATPFNIPLQPRQSVIVSRSFVVPAAAKAVGLVITHEGAFPIGWFIVGYDTWFRKPALLPLE